CRLRRASDVLLVAVGNPADGLLGRGVDDLDGSLARRSDPASADVELLLCSHHSAKLPDGNGSDTSSSMKAAVCYERNQPVRVDEVTLDPPRRDEVRVRLAATGVCHSD